MVTKTKKTSGGESTAQSASTAQLANTVRESAQQIWLAGLGANTKTQKKNNKKNKAQNKKNTTQQRKTQSAAEEKFSEATNRVASMATDITSKASGQWDKLENIFEDRVSRALKKLGVPTHKDIDALVARIDELNRNVSKLSSTRAAKSSSRPTAKAAPKRAARRSA